jgi:hypothetical protein
MLGTALVRGGLPPARFWESERGSVWPQHW